MSVVVQISIPNNLRAALDACREPGESDSAQVRAALIAYVSAKGCSVVPVVRPAKATPPYRSPGRPKLPGHVVKLGLRGPYENLVKVLDEALAAGLMHTPRGPEVFGRPDYGTSKSLLALRLTEAQIGVLAALKPTGPSMRLWAAHVSTFPSLDAYLDEIGRNGQPTGSIGA